MKAEREGLANNALSIGYVIDNSLQQLAKLGFLAFIVAWGLTCTLQKPQGLANCHIWTPIRLDCTHSVQSSRGVKVWGALVSPASRSKKRRDGCV